MSKAGESRAEALEAAVEFVSDGIAILDSDGRYVEMNETHAEVYGYEHPDSLIGEHWSVCYSGDELERFETEVMPILREADEWQGEAIGRRKNGDPFPQELTLTALEDGGLVCIVRDVSEQVGTENLYRTIAENISRGAVFLFDDEFRYTLVVGEAFQEFDLPPEDLEGRTIYETFPEDRLDDVESHYETVEGGASAGFEVEFADRIFDVSLHPLGEMHAEHVGVGIAEDITERRRRERNLRSLHEASRKLTYADTVEETAETTITIAEEVLESPLSTLWRYEQESDDLRALAITDASADLLGVESKDDLPRVTTGELGMEAFREGTTRAVPDYGAVDSRAFDAPFGGVLLVPLGEYGLLEVGRHEIGGFSEADRRQAETLGANAQAALENAESEALLRDRTEELGIRNAQMEFINSILRHDVLNGMTVIRSRGAFLEEDLEGTQSDYAETIVRWCDDITEFVERVQTVLNALSGEDDRSLKPVDVSALVRPEFTRLEQTYPDVTFGTDLPANVFVEADELLADVVGNLATNAIEHNDPDGLVVEASVERHGGTVAIRIADNGQGIASNNRESVFRRGESHAKSAGSGFGLFFVDAMVEAYGGDVRVEDNEPGAAFVLELPAWTARDAEAGDP